MNIISFCFLFSVVWSLQLGFKANERNVVKPVIVCNSEEQRDVVQVRVMRPGKLVWSVKRLGRLFGFGRTRTEVGKLFLLLYIFKNLMLDSVCNTSHFFQVASSLFSCPRKS